MPRPVAACIAVAITSAMAPHAAIAQDEPVAKVGADSAAMPEFPTSPAFNALGANPTTVLRPTTVRSLGSEILSTFKGGDVKVGVAIEASPYWLWKANTITLSDWRTDYGTRLLSRATLSLATTGSDSAGVTEVSEGLKLVLWDETDPRFDEKLEQCVQSALAASDAPVAPGDGGGDDTAGAPQSSAAIKACQEAAAKRLRSGSVGAIAFAATQAATADGDDPAALGDLEQRKAFGWLSAGRAWPRLELAGAARVMYDNRGDEAGVTELAVGGNVRFGTSAFAASISGAWTPNWTDAEDEGGANAWVFGGSVELSIGNNQWLIVETGARAGPDAIGDQLESNLSYRIGAKPTEPAGSD